MDVFGIADWQTLATGPFAESLGGGPGVQTRASAKNLIKGFDGCEVVQMKLASHIPGPADEILSYEQHNPTVTAYCLQPLPIRSIPHCRLRPTICGRTLSQLGA
jgi:hypothetical protein